MVCISDTASGVYSWVRSKRKWSVEQKCNTPHHNFADGHHSTTFFLLYAEVCTINFLLDKLID